MSDNNGFLVPEWYVAEEASETDMNTASIFWGFSIAVGLFSAAKAANQTMKSYRRSGRITAYVIMIWANWTSSMIIGAIAWFFQRGIIKASFQFYFFVAFFWVFQIQLLLQIIINRIGLLMMVPQQVTRLKWTVFLIILVINISVFVIWIPARLQISKTWMDINNIWDRCEKAIFCVVDVCLNLYFVRLTRTRLVNNGLTKYIPLYRANLFLVCVSMSLDVVLIGLMSLPSSLVYLQFHPVAYLLKLQIEMTMADLITKIVRSSNGDRDYYSNSRSGGRSKSGATTGNTAGKKAGRGAANVHNLTFTEQNRTHVGVGDRDTDYELRERNGTETPQPDTGIRKTVETVVNSEPRVGRDSQEREIDDSESQSSSTRKLHYHYGLKPA